MKALSIKQPWAHVILYGGKDCENRTWNTKHRGNFLIHVGQNYDDLAVGYWRRRDLSAEDDNPICRLFRKCPAKPNLDLEDWMGAIVGMANLYEVIHFDPLDGICDSRGESFPQPEWYDFEASDGMYGFMLKNVKPFSSPIPCKGRLNFFTPPEDVLWRVYEEMGGK